MSTQTEAKINRTAYGEITNPPAFVTKLLIDAARAGCWTTGIASDRKQRGSAINTAVYGWDDKEGVAVVQVRQAIFHPRKFTKVRKDYYLIGRVEDGSIFAHAIDSPLRSTLAMSCPQYCADYVRAKIWGIKIDQLPELIRQGDVAFIPVMRIPASAVDANGQSQLIRDTHKLTGKIWLDGSAIYCERGAKLVHTKGEHAPIKAKSGFYRVQPGYRAEVWGFSAPTPD